MNKEIQELSAKISKQLNDKGLLIEAGFAGLCIMCFGDKEIPKYQKDELRNFFFAGAQHLFSTMINIMDSDREPTIEDMRHMDLINDELRRFIQNFELKNIKPAGNA